MTNACHRSRGCKTIATSLGPSETSGQRATRDLMITVRAILTSPSQLPPRDMRGMRGSTTKITGLLLLRRSRLTGTLTLIRMLGARCVWLVPRLMLSRLLPMMTVLAITATLPFLQG